MSSIRQASALVAFGLLAATVLQAQNAPVSAEKTTVPAEVVELDRAVAVVNRHVILASDVDDEIRIAVLDPSLVGETSLSRAHALDQLISRSLIEQQIRREEAQSIDPSPTEVQERLNEIRHNLPACVHHNCASDEGWKEFLASNSLTPERVMVYLRYRLQILAFIELRFRAGIRIPAEDVRDYYRQTLVPQYKPGEVIPSLHQVEARIEEILLEQHVNALFEDWLTNLRKQGDIEVLDPALADEAAPSASKEAKP
ncbi:hypothetical protein ACOBR2_06970 [Telmatobacter bradus]|uniref:hypothetical protein n=1 Tax=Telmatobacter bradus TaxID=474953 RepID=UPI003B42D653